MSFMMIGNNINSNLLFTQINNLISIPEIDTRRKTIIFGTYN